MGPDEYHDGYVGAAAPGLRNNAYTNVMAVWVLCRALELVDLLPEPRRSELRERLALDDAELARWEDVSRKMRLVFHDDGVISQFEGYEDLVELDWDGYRARYGDISRLDRILEGEDDTPNAYKVSKQADVLMLFYLLSANELRVDPRTAGLRLRRRPPSPGPSTTTCSGPRTDRPSAEWCTAGCWPAPTVSVRGSSSKMPCTATSTTLRAVPPPKESIWAPWPARSTSCSAATWASRRAMT